MIELFIFVVFVLITNTIVKKINLIPNYHGQIHQIYLEDKNVPLIGGFYILFLLSVLFFNNLSLLIFFFSIFVLGILSDKNLIISPKKRFIIQILIVFIFTIQFDLFISSSRNELMDLFLSNFYFKFLFSTFCILILINGSNFIDGMNGILLSYFSIIIFILFKTNFIDTLNIDLNLLYLFFYCLLFLVFLNYFGFFFLGDNGSYLIGLCLSYILISTFNDNQTLMTPYFIILLVWYPCFENLFSIIRKIKSGFSATKSDNKHLHQLIFNFLTKKLSLKKKYSNPLTGILITIPNFLIIYSASLQPNLTMYQLYHILFSTIFYFLIYFFLIRNFD